MRILWIYLLLTQYLYSDPLDFIIAVLKKKHDIIQYNDSSSNENQTNHLYQDFKTFADNFLSNIEIKEEYLKNAGVHRNFYNFIGVIHSCIKGHKQVSVFYNCTNFDNQKERILIEGQTFLNIKNEIFDQKNIPKDPSQKNNNQTSPSEEDITINKILIKKLLMKKSLTKNEEELQEKFLNEYQKKYKGHNFSKKIRRAIGVIPSLKEYEHIKPHISNSIQPKMNKMNIKKSWIYPLANNFFAPIMKIY